MLIKILSCLLAVIYPILLIMDIHQQTKTQKKVDGLLKLINEYQKNSEQSFKLLNDELDLLESNSKNQTKYNNLFTDQLTKQWVAIKLVVNEIHSRR